MRVSEAGARNATGPALGLGPEKNGASSKNVMMSRIAAIRPFVHRPDVRSASTWSANAVSARRADSPDGTARSAAPSRGRSPTSRIPTSCLPGVAGQARPGLGGAVTPGVAGEARPGLGGAVTPGVAGEARPGLGGGGTPGVAGGGRAGLGGAV